MKARITLDLDFAQLGASTPDEAYDLILKQLIQPARARHKAALQTVRRDTDLADEAKAQAIAEHVRAMMMTLMAEANLSVQMLPENAQIAMELPFEKSSLG